MLACKVTFNSIQQ